MLPKSKLQTFFVDTVYGKSFLKLDLFPSPIMSIACTFFVNWTIYKVSQKKVWITTCNSSSNSHFFWDTLYFDYWNTLQLVISLDFSTTFDAFYWTPCTPSKLHFDPQHPSELDHIFLPDPCCCSRPLWGSSRCSILPWKWRSWRG